MAEIIREGHAAILVSHAMPVVRRSSQMCLWFSHGRIVMFGSTDEVVDRYRGRREKLERKRLVVARFVSWLAESRLCSDPHTLSASHEEVTFRFECSDFTFFAFEPRFLQHQLHHFQWQRLIHSDSRNTGASLLTERTSDGPLGVLVCQAAVFGWKEFDLSENSESPFDVID